MINPFRHASAFWAPMVVILFGATATYSQAPTDAQRSGIRAQCRADYQAHCASIPPGGKASLQCLQQNMSSLSSGCQAAVARRRSSGGAQSGNSPGCAGRVCPGRRNGQAGRGAASGIYSGSGSQDGGKHPGQKAEQCAGERDTKRVPQRLSRKLRRRSDRRRCGIKLPSKEQGKPFGKLSESGQRGWRRRGTCGRRCCGACGWRRSDGCNNRRLRSGARCGAGARAGAAVDAAPRSAFRPEVGLQRGCSHALRRRSTRRRPCHPMPGRAGSLPFTCVRGCSRAVRGAMTNA
jgi:hypothetical protein